MGTLISFPHSGSTSSGYLSLPASGTGPGVIVIQEWWGLVDHIKDLCDRFAAAGYVALAPDLYNGKATTSPDEAGKLMMALKISEAEATIRAAIDVLLAHPATTGSRVGTIGFCMGGQLSLYSACVNPKVGACVDFYGVHSLVEAPFEKLSCEVLGLFAELDKGTGPAVVHDLEARIRAAGKTCEMIIYPGTQHAFFNDARPMVYNADAAADAWKRVLAFFERTLTH